MNLLLFRKTIIISSLTDNEIISRLSEIVDLEQSNLGKTATSKQYVGKIDDRKFKIQRITKGRNSFRPVIYGNIIDNFSTKSIELKMRLHFLVMLFLIWVSALIVFYLVTSNDYHGLFFIGLLFSQTIFFFNQECNRSTKDSKELFIT